LTKHTKKHSLTLLQGWKKTIETNLNKVKASLNVSDTDVEAENIDSDKSEQLDTATDETIKT